MATICALAVVLAGVAAYGWHVGWFAKSTSNGHTTTPQPSQTSA
ncbi:beta-glucosidase, partial [Bifidobacterium longum]